MRPSTKVSRASRPVHGGVQGASALNGRRPKLTQEKPYEGLDDITNSLRTLRHEVSATLSPAIVLRFLVSFAGEM